MFTAFGFQGGTNEAKSFIAKVNDVGGSLTTTEENALIDMVASFKTESLWSDLDILFPFVGDVEASCALSMKYTDLYSSSFDAGVWTFDSSGITGDVASTATMLTNAPTNINYPGVYGYGIYVGVDASEAITLHSRDSAVLSNNVVLSPRNGSVTQARYSDSTYFTETASASSIGHWNVYSNGTSLGGGYAKNGSVLNSDTTSSRANSADTDTVCLGNTSNNFGILYGGRCVTSGNLSTINTIIQQFITDIGR